MIECDDGPYIPNAIVPAYGSHVEWLTPGGDASKRKSGPWPSKQEFLGSHLEAVSVTEYVMFVSPGCLLRGPTSVSVHVGGSPTRLTGVGLSDPTCWRAVLLCMV